MKTKRNRKGFTLAELLVVAAIIAILVSVATPIYTVHLERARMAVDRANARAASSLAYSEYMLAHSDINGIKSDEEPPVGMVSYKFGMDENKNLFILEHRDVTDLPIDDGCNTDGDEILPCSKLLDGEELIVVIDDGAVVWNTWLAALGSKG